MKKEDLQSRIAEIDLNIQTHQQAINQGTSNLNALIGARGELIRLLEHFEKLEQFEKEEKKQELLKGLKGN